MTGAVACSAAGAAPVAAGAGGVKAMLSCGRTAMFVVSDEEKVTPSVPPASGRSTHPQLSTPAAQARTVAVTSIRNAPTGTFWAALPAPTVASAAATASTPSGLIPLVHPFH